MDAEQEFRGLLERLHVIMVNGEGDSEAADRIREQMDKPWYAMTTEQQERMRAYSEELGREGEGQWQNH